MTGPGTGAAEVSRPIRDTQQVEAWVNEGGSLLPAATLPVRILIIDNDSRSADALEGTLRTAGYSETRVASSGRDALAIAADFHPTVVLLELDLLELDGYELARALRQQAQSDALRLIALTSSRKHDGRERARAAGFERYLLKPVSSTELLELLGTPSGQGSTTALPWL
jgi:CheY-like chemotaxis protein